MARRMLEGVELVINWTSLGGALEGALRFLGEAVTTPWVMGISGLAFRLALPITGEGIAAPGTEAAFDPVRAAALIANLGREVTIVRAQPGTRDYPKRRDAAIKQVRRSINRGIPAIVYDLHLPQFGLVRGYDDRAAIWQVRTVMSAQYGEAVPLSRWPVPERPGGVLVVLLGKPTRVVPQRAVWEALRFAVEYAERGDPGDPTGALHGLAAYESWQGAFAHSEPVSAPGNAALVQTLQSARRDASAFLRGEASRLLPEAAAHLKRAATAYDAEVLALSRMATMFPYPTGGDPDSPAARLVAIAALRDARTHERAALSALHAALSIIHP